MTASITTVGTLLSEQAQTTDGSTPVLLGTYLPNGTISNSTAAIVMVVGLDEDGYVFATNTIVISAGNVLDGYHLISRVDLVPMRSGSMLAHQNCQVSFTVNAAGINVYVVGVVARTINWSVYMTGSNLGVV